MQPVRKLSLGLIGVLFILGGTVAKVVSPPPTDSAGAAGAATALAIFWVAGITMIIVHFVKKRA